MTDGAPRAAVLRPRASTALALALAGAAAGCNDAPAEACGPGDLCPFAGTGQAAFNGDGRSLLDSALYFPVDVHFPPGGGTYLMDFNNHRLRRVDPSGRLETVMGTDFVGDGPPGQEDLVPPGAPGPTVPLNHPTDLVAAPDGSLLVAAWHNHKLRRLDPVTLDVLVVAGSGPGYAGDGEPLGAERTQFDQPSHLVIDGAGTYYVLDQRNQCVRRIANDAVATVTTVVGIPTAPPAFAGDGGAPRAARLALPTGPNPEVGGGLALDALGRLYLSDTDNHRVRRVDFDAGDGGVIETVAGTGEAGFSGDGGDAREARLNGPRDLALSADGAVLYIADSDNHRVRALDVATNTLRTVAGTGAPGSSGDGGPATLATLRRPFGVALDLHGDLYIADTYNHRIRKVPR